MKLYLGFIIFISEYYSTFNLNHTTKHISFLFKFVLISEKARTSKKEFRENGLGYYEPKIDHLHLTFLNVHFILNFQNYACHIIDVQHSFPPPFLL